MASELKSVGGAYRENDMMSVDHPYYRSVSDLVSERVHELGVERGLAKASVRTVLMGIALQPFESYALAEAYPELNIIAAGQARPGHAYWVAYRRAANEWLMEQADKMSSSVAHLGGSLASYLFAGIGSSATLLCDLTEPIAVHEKYATTMEAHAMFENHVGLSKMIGRRLDHRVYDAYLRRDGVRFHSKLNAMPDCEVMLVDLTIASYNPMQVASMMKQSGAGVCLGFFVYHPSMLFAREGEVGDTGVRFSRLGDHMLLRYPEGSAGVTDYGAHTWDSWLLGHTFRMGTGVGAQWYQLELLRNRGHLMFFRMTALSCEPEQKVISHALDVGDADSYIVSSWALKHFGANPSRRESWAYGSHVVKKRIVDRLYQFAMQLPKEQFTRYALRKQVSVINDRITVEGTMVTVVKPLSVEVVDALVVAVYSRAFVDRYESTQLTAEAMKAIKSVNAFAGAGALAKMGYIAMVCMQTAYDYTFGTVDQVMRTTSDAVRRRLSTGLMPMEVAIDTMPPYILVSEAALGTGLSPDVGSAVAAENSRLAALASSGFSSRWSKAFATLTQPCPDDVYRRYRVEEVNLMRVAKAVGPAVDAALAAVRQEVALDEASVSRTAVDATMVVRNVRAELRVDFEPVSDPVEILNALHSSAFPGVAEQDLEHDVASLSFDPQDRMLAASRLVLPVDFGPGPVSRSYYKSKLRALNVPKRQQTLQELLSSIAARNLNAPQIALPQDEDSLVLDVWSVFLRTACVDGVEHKLAMYRSDPVSLSEDSFREWAMQSDSSKLEALRKELSDSLISFAGMSVSEYLVMLKSDVKPPMSVKPLSQRTEPQVIVYHAKALSGLFSSLFRVLVRRFLSLLKPEYHVNLLKDTRDIEDFLRAIHPFGNSKLKYLENDFSKYDKSQGRFAFLLEAFVFEQLGMNQEMLDKWLGGHVKCSMRAVSMMLRLEVWYQRKSGDATTAYGNVLINLLSTTYAYKMSKIKWALYMGDDSLICCEDVLGASSAVDTLAEVFNLGAKMFVTESPYFASNFVFFDDAAEDVAMVADPVKRVERWSMSLSADDPQWSERYISACDALQNYLSVHKLSGMSKALLERYGIPTDASAGVGAAIATLLSSEAKFRTIWEEFPEVSNY